MVKKLLVVLALAIVALLAHDHGRRISEQDVRAHYGAQATLLAGADTEALCKAMAADFHLRDVQHVSGTTTREELDRDAACRRTGNMIRLMGMLSQQTGGLVALELGYDITRIEIAPGGRRAVVEATTTARLGGRLISRSRTREELSRSLWQVRSHGGEGQTWNYLP